LQPTGQHPLTTTLSARAELRATALIYTATFSYMITLGSTLILVPLYALHLGFDLAELGVIVGSQALFGLFLRLFAGAICDQFGERWVLWGSFGTMVVGATIFAVSGTFWALILAQTFLGISRATYWTSTQSYGSRINPAKSGTLLGRMSSSGTAGQMVGAALAGLVAETMGYGWAWTGVIALGALGLAGSSVLPVLPRKDLRRGFKQALAPVPALARNPSMAMAGFTAFTASTSMTIAVILLVPYLSELGNGETTIGLIRTVGSVGSVVIGIVFGKIVAKTGQQNLYMSVLTLMGLTMLAIPLAGSGLLALTALMFSYGTLHGVLGPLYPLTASTYSTQEQRGMAIAYVGLYWAAAQVTVPAVFGVVAANVGLEASFWVAGALFLAFAIAMPILFPLLTKRHQTVHEPTA
jgi:DHA1 family tetracycline resistance protein-like MFS transporter